MVALFWVAACLAILLAWAVFARNRLVRLQLQAEESWRDIDTQLKRRWELIPNLVEVASGYAEHEAGLFVRIAEARAQAAQAAGPRDLAAAEDGLKSALFPLFLLSEKYPDLLASESFSRLQRSLEEAENALQKSRRVYNAVVRELNTAVMSFPKSILAAMFRIDAREYYMLAEEEARWAASAQMR